MQAAASLARVHGHLRTLRAGQLRNIQARHGLGSVKYARQPMKYARVKRRNFGATSAVPVKRKTPQMEPGTKNVKSVRTPEQLAAAAAGRANRKAAAAAARKK
jgi:hypothetical protein